MLEVADRRLDDVLVVQKGFRIANCGILWLGQCDVADPHGRSNRLLAFTAGRATGKNNTLRECSPVNAHTLGYDGYTVQQWTIRGGSKLELCNEVL